ncbi:hypothetical protein [Caulobacter mirabilis]|uniref:Right handed beta helix domain-containing protein n=1 Tax=Caulobacter mirabilis TaxID=69666 RepID=A0A2D2AWS8_9CAUL|nr:hypothetical protein [Caulobacter mirabilis]ATQ42469.1 hypothetical protein CSW64_08600 [Caulobacter mirabilis]
MSSEFSRREALASIGAVVSAEGSAPVRGPDATPRGGAVMNLDLWARFETMQAPLDVGVVQTGGYASPGVGGARYVLDEDQRSGKSSPARRRSANGRWFKLSEQTLSPTMFGARPHHASPPSDTAAWQAALDYAADQEGVVIDMAGGRYRCGPLVVRQGCRHLTIANGYLEIDGDVTWLKGAEGADRITYLAVENVFFDHSGARTVQRPIIDASLFSYARFSRLWAYNAKQNVSVLIHVAGSYSVGPYYCVVDQCYCGGFYAGVHLAAAKRVEETANNWTISECRFQPNRGFFGVIVGHRNQNVRILSNAFENVQGGCGVRNDGDGTVLIGNRFEGLATGIHHGAQASGWSEIGSYHNSNQQDRVFEGGAEGRGVLLGDYDTNTGAGRPSYLAKALAVNVGVGRINPWAAVHVGGGALQTGDPGFPESPAVGSAFSYASPALGHVDGGRGGVNDRTFVNGSGAVAGCIPAGTVGLDWKGPVSWMPARRQTPTQKGQMAFELTADNKITIRVRGADGVVRAGSITLA